VCVAAAAPRAQAQVAACPGFDAVAGQIVSLENEVLIRTAGDGGWTAATLDQFICPGDQIRTGGESRAAVWMPVSETVVRIDQLTTIVFETASEERSVLELLDGAMHFLSQVPAVLEVKTPYLNAGIEGTEVHFRTNRALKKTFVTVFEGNMRTLEEDGLLISTGGSAAGAEGEDPQPYPSVRLVDGQEVPVPPRQAVGWTIYYPPVLTAQAAGAPVSESLRRAQALLSVGRAAAAGKIIDDALARDPGDGSARALSAIIALAQGRLEDAENQARQAVESNPDSAPALIALSYVWQGQGRLDEARDILLQAGPAENPLAWARLAELWLATGYRGRALDAANRAAALPPALARTHVVLGFAALAVNDLAAAEQAFLRAIELDSAYPMARTGLGLAKIAGGDLDGGRRDLEIAAMLDPERSLTRSYLGKAYFEEHRNQLAREQYGMAIERDPNDPTPWLYDAVQLLTENRPAEALHALQESIRRNDNRAVYRSDLLLDEDLAVRGSALARIYDELGFDRRAVVEASKSLTIDPGDHSAHRFLADAYSELPRHEIARSSELLQAQLLQPINLDPVQPQLLVTDLNIIAGAGPADVALNEFTPVFRADGLRFDVTGFGGTQETYGDEAVLSGVFDWLSFSLGQFHYSSDGFRTNNDVEHDIYSAFIQTRLGDDLDLQFEFRRRRTEQGDLRLNFDPTDFLPFERRDIEEDSYRISAHYEPQPGHDVLASFTYGEGGERIDDIVGLGSTFLSDSSDRSYDGQARYIFDGESINFTAGLTVTEIDADQRIVIDSTPVFGDLCGMLPFPCVDETFPDVSAWQHNVYAYLDAELFDGFVATAGLSYDGFERGALDVGRVNPKAGFQWDITDYIRLRAAYLRTVKRALIADQTLEPTHVAGFNQFFDDVDGTRAERIGAAIDITFNDDLYGGFEYSRRELEVPSIDTSGFGPPLIIEDQTAQLYRGYLYWTPGPRWAFSGEVHFEQIERDMSSPFPLPVFVDTFMVPLAVGYFHPSGFFARFGATYVDQAVGLPPGSVPAVDSDSFFLLDASLGYRLPDRRGLFAIEIGNLLDEQFRYQDTNIQDQEPSNPVFIPELTVLARLTLTF